MFVTIEGPEGSGKSSVTKEVVKRLNNEGIEVILTREPGGTPIAEEIRNVILDKKNTNMDSRTEALLYAAARRQHLVEKIWPAIKEGKIVLCDRFLDSSLAYQGEGRKLGIENILNVNLFATENTYPDLTLFFNISPEEGLKRVSKDKKRVADRLDNENANFHQVVYNGFLKVNSMYKDRVQVVDATKSLNEVIENAYKIIKSKLEN